MSTKKNGLVTVGQEWAVIPFSFSDLGVDGWDKVSTENPLEIITGDPPETPTGVHRGFSSEIPPGVFSDLPPGISTGFSEEVPCGIPLQFLPVFLPRFLQVFTQTFIPGFPQEFLQDYSWSSFWDFSRNTFRNALWDSSRQSFLQQILPSRNPPGVTSQVPLIVSSRIFWGYFSKITPIIASGIPP